MDTQDRFIWADWITEERENKGWSQSELARKADINRQVINDYESHRRTNPDVEFLAKISEALGYPADYLPRLAGKLPQKPDKDELIEQAEYLLSKLKYKQTRETAIALLDALVLQEERGTYDPNDQGKT